VIDLTETEQANVRAALRFLRYRAGGWKAMAPVLGFKKKTLTNVSEGRAVSANMAFRVARLAGVPVDDLLTGKFPLPGACAHCGRNSSGAPGEKLVSARR
jgi:hypothetical protein